MNINLSPDIPFDIGPDKIICRDSVITLTAPAGFLSYNWSPNYNLSNRYSNTTLASPVKDTTYSVVAQKADGCIVIDTIAVKLIEPKAFSLGKDSSLCFGDKLFLKAPDGFTAYTWQDGTINQSFTVNKDGFYWLTAKDNNGCTVKDTIEIIKKECYAVIYFPNAFTPNNNGLNDIYKPVAYGELKNFTIHIYNRWGQLVFKSDNISNGWNGSFKNKPQTSDVFVYYAVFKFKGTDQKLQTAKGTITLIK